MNLLPPKRFRSAWGIALGATILAIIFTIGPNVGGIYDPYLAVLTLTLIAIIWYTYFNYRAIHREESTLLRVGLAAQINPSSVVLFPSIQNLTRRTVRLKPNLEVWLDNSAVSLIEFYSGTSEASIGPYDGFQGRVPLDEEVMQPKQNSSGELLFTRKELKVRFKTIWTDDIGEKGTVGPYHWYADFQKRPSELVAIIAPENIQFKFGHLP